MRAGGVEQAGHEVRVLARRDALELAQRLLDLRGVAPGAGGLDAADLLALQGGIDAWSLEVDPKTPRY